MARNEDVLRLLLVEESLSDAESVIALIRRTGHAVRASRFESLEDITQAIKNHSWDVILCRDGLKEVSPQDLLKLVHHVGRDIPCLILVSEQEHIDDYYDLGAKDVLQFSDTPRLPFALARELDSLYIRRLSRRNERALRESEKRSRLLLESSRDAVAYVHEGMHIYVNHSYLTLFGYEDTEDVDGLSILDMISSADHAKFKTAYRKFSEQSDSNPQEVTVICVNTESEEFEAAIEFSHAEVEGESCTQLVIREKVHEIMSSVSDDALAEIRDHDSLTGLYNRVRFMDELDSAVKRVDEGNEPSELLYLVIDDFQKIKEQVGLAACDMVLKGVAELLRADRVEGEVLARYSDQVFTILISSGDDTYVDQRAEVYRKIVDDYVSQAGGKMIDLQCSIGISRITESLASSSVGLDRADKACIQAQRAGGNKVIRYKPAVSEQGAAESSEESGFWVERIKEMLKSDGFSLHYQPIVSLHGEVQELYDVLIRMNEEDGTVTEADKFLPFIEESNLMNNIDDWVISHALSALAEHRIENPKTRFFIKLSKQTLNKANFIDWINQLMTEHDLPGSALVFEISETAALEHLDYTKNVIAQLKGIGCEFGLEHFGSGLDFSHSLAVLDVDYLKINGDFVENMAKDPENQAAVKSIIDMSKQAGKHSIAEFVSDANSLALLWRLGVDYAMGYYIQEPSANLDYNFEDDNL